MEKTMQEVLHENKMKVRSRLEEQRKKAKKEEIKKNVLFTLSVGFMLLAAIMLLASINNRQMDKCTSAGHSISYCERGM